MNNYDNSIRLLASGFADSFAEMLAGDERIHELMMEIAEEFVDNEIPVVSEEAKIDVSAELLMNVTVTKVG
jgi:hypothetical protein